MQKIGTADRLAECRRRADVENGPRADIVGVDNLRVVVEDRESVAVDAYGLQRLSLLRHVYLVASSLSSKQAPPFDTGEDDRRRRKQEKG
ncbi:hypothetical protein MA16_Dca025086 [Dendrobium catenatum]|uniref:Uncharacterized protein n=1 Tax=Dendrobium catenatum TaxID=906689 RepID=A0A2I0WWP4_9ASPA|nr:hypothetical protein MA16_Dca025086 [Dendrobium catenatum]